MKNITRDFLEKMEEKINIVDSWNEIQKRNYINSTMIDNYNDYINGKIFKIVVNYRDFKNYIDGNCNCKKGEYNSENKTIELTMTRIDIRTLGESIDVDNSNAIDYINNIVHSVKDDIKFFKEKYIIVE